MTRDEFAQQYVNAIRNANKKAYAEQYLNHLRGLRDYPRRGALSIMAMQSVERRLLEIWKENS